MSKDWTPEELEAVSRYMAARGLPSYKEFCALITETVSLSQDDAENAASSQQEQL